MDSEAAGGAALVEMAGISKAYGGVRAVSGVDFTVLEGEVHALLGENGAGKSTLMKVLSGEVGGYEGEIRVSGEPVHFTRPVDAQRAGIAMIHQELDLVPALSVAENVFLGRELKTRYGVVDRGRMVAETGELLDRAGVALDPRRPIDQLRTGEQQLVTIAKALSLDARILIMDEPTSALSSHEVEQLFTVIAELRRGGAGIVYISHRMDEIGRVADRATVLRNGSVVAEFDARAMTAAQASEAMVGRPVHLMFRTEAEPDSAHLADEDDGDDLLRVEDLEVRQKRPKPGRRDPAGISLRVRRGEIVGLAGLLGAGRTELLETLYGVGSGRPTGGRILLDGKEIAPSGPRQALKLGIAFLPEDRRIAGLSLEHSVLANTVLSIVERIARLGAVPRAKERALAAETTERLGVKLASLASPVGSLSGGNQQKVVLGRNLLTEPSLLLLDEPTRGVDVGAKAEIYRLLGETASRGVGVLLASSEPAELIGVCDRVIVLQDGRSVQEIDTASGSEADLLAASMGEGAVSEELGERA
ncbi:sugar ABC transporter ATP-binding protein [Amycolatopsis sp. CA-230715]|uniref:sugar ABC transporter ATP-binding protein n=1 Tax=Amycolatopsis sp. CA-230715 TaxID=2745196 RepID=UPI001C00FF7F|nr:sugar ABC transporter ATP-binding protein [Amycolatopsis sp. CA-230715]QWF77226.1 Ribose import ATP-binding protein RbsA [Amycolatopsis sp. CA-230715]